MTADPNSPAGYAVRSDIIDIVEIFEVNRKECARILVEYPKWTVKGTFKPRPGDPADSPDRIPLPGRDWQLESTLIEVLVVLFLHLLTWPDLVHLPLGHLDNTRRTVPPARESR